MVSFSFASLHKHETIDLLTQHASAVRFWQCEKPSLLRFSSDLQEMDKIMETLRNSGIEFVMVTLKELKFATLNVLPFVYNL
jgi:hypothetical protein